MGLASDGNLCTLLPSAVAQCGKATSCWWGGPTLEPEHSAFCFQLVPSLVVSQDSDTNDIIVTASIDRVHSVTIPGLCQQ